VTKLDYITVKKILEVTKGSLLSGNEEIKIKGASTNSKQINDADIFVAIKGERVDGHKFIDMALNSGATATFTEKKLDNYLENKAYILVDNSLKALQKLAKYIRSLYNVSLVGITGSVGKTTTKEMIAAALEKEKDILKTAGNMNSQIGLSLMMFRFEKAHKMAVIEMGVSEFKEMVNLVDIARPNMAVVTNIGVSHISQFKTRENILKEKLQIIDKFTGPNNILFINGEDDILSKDLNEYDLYETTKKALEKIKVIRFGTSSNCDYRAKDIETKNGKCHFTAVFDGIERKIELNVVGIHNVYNALVALAVANNSGVSIDSAIKGLKGYKPLAMRGTIEKKGNLTIIDDTYNASPDSMKSGVNVLLSLEDVEKRYAVLADILELGESSYQCHYDVGKYISDKNVDEVVVIGNEAKAIVEAIKDSNAKIITHTFDTNKEAVVYLKESFENKKCAILVKGSR